MKSNPKNIVPVDRIVISMQPVERAAELQKALQNSSIEFFNMPMIYTETTALDVEILNCFNDLQTIDILIFTSRNGVKGFFNLLSQAKKKLSEKTKIAVIGKGTAKTLEEKYRQADFIQPGNTSRDFVVYLKNQVLRGGERILLALGNLAPDFLQNELTPHASVRRITVYRTLPVGEFNADLMRRIRDNQYGLLVFSSPSAFANFHDKYQKEKTDALLRIVSIGETTTQAILKTMQAFVLTAKTSGTEGLLNEIKKYFHLKN